MRSRGWGVDESCKAVDDGDGDDDGDEDEKVNLSWGYHDAFVVRGGQGRESLVNPRSGRPGTADGPESKRMSEWVNE